MPRSALFAIDDGYDHCMVARLVGLPQTVAPTVW